MNRFPCFFLSFFLSFFLFRYFEKEKKNNQIEQQDMFSHCSYNERQREHGKYLFKGATLGIEHVNDTDCCLLFYICFSHKSSTFVYMYMTMSNIDMLILLIGTIVIQPKKIAKLPSRTTFECVRIGIVLRTLIDFMNDLLPKNAFR
jgi:hypothetical protein